MHEAYQPIIDDGRGHFPEDLRVKAPRGARAAIADAAEIKNTSHSEYVLECSLGSTSDSKDTEERHVAYRGKLVPGEQSHEPYANAVGQFFANRCGGHFPWSAVESALACHAE